LYRLSDLGEIEVARLDTTLWEHFIIDSQPDVLILNDWEGVGNQARNDPRQFENNARHSRLAIAGRDAGAKMIIGVGSQAELGPINSSISENSIDNPTTLYGEAKVQIRKNIEGLLMGTETKFIWMRIFSTYGPLDEGSWLIPNIVDSLEKDKEIELTKGEQEWSYLHAYDLAMAFAAVINHAGIKGIVNVGNPDTLSIRSAASTVGKILGKEELIKFGALEYRLDQVMRLQPLSETLGRSGWRPEISFDEGIRQTIGWLTRKELLPLKTVRGKLLHFNLPVRP
jgi:nucleoside-diphosphate-sugar epimerase